MTEASIFEAPVDNTPADDVDLIGETGRYKDTKIASQAIIEKDKTIAAREQELAGLREELRQRLSLEEFMDRLNSREPAPQAPPQAEPQAVDPEAIAGLVEKRFQEARQKERRAENVRQVTRALEDTFGKQYPARLAELTEKMGVSQEYLQNMAATAPQAFLALVQASGPAPAPQQSEPPLVPQSRIDFEKRPASRTPKMADYKELKAKDPQRYWSPKIQNEIMANAEKYGRSFYEP